jgi:hypothetical protein
MLFQEFNLLDCFHSLADDVYLHSVSHIYNRRNHNRIVFFQVISAEEGTVKLQYVNREVLEQAE